MNKTILVVTVGDNEYPANDEEALKIKEELTSLIKNKNSFDVLVTKYPISMNFVNVYDDNNDGVDVNIEVGVCK